MKAILLLSLIIISLSAISCYDSSVNTFSNSNEQLVAEIKSAADSITANTEVPGVFVLVSDKIRGIDWMYGSGLSDIPNNIPVNFDYNFRVGSITKTFTVTVLLQLAGEGKISLNDKLSLYFPQYPKSDSITIRMLCNMTSRIRNYTNQTFFNEIWANPTRVWTPEELINRGFAGGFDSIPGKGFSYSNTNTILLGKIIQKVTGNSLETEINNRIIQPLQLLNTGFLTSGIQLPGNHGRGYFFADFLPRQDYTEYFDLSAYWSAGSVYSKPRELQKYAEVLVKGGLLPDSLQQKRLKDDYYDLGNNDAYGLGLFRHGTFYGHSGELQGFMTSMYHSNDKNCTVIVYYNSLLRESPVEDLTMKILRIMYGDNY